jgi:hypothetical protein
MICMELWAALCCDYFDLGCKVIGVESHRELLADVANVRDQMLL